MKKKLVNFSRLNYEKILETYNIQNIKQRGKWLTFSCPFGEHEHGDKRPSAAIGVDSGGWNCFGCKRSGTIINFVADYEGIDLVHAINKLQKIANGELVDEETLLAEFEKMLSCDPEVVQEQGVFIAETTIPLFEVDWKKAELAWFERKLPKTLQYPFTRNLNSRTLNEYQIGYDFKSRRITVPYRNKDGRLLGFKGRATVAYDDKYLCLGDTSKKIYGWPTFKVSDHVWGIHDAGPDLIIVEGEFDALSLRSRGYMSAVALGGSQLSNNQAKLLIEKGASATLLLDPDQAGKKIVPKLIKTLEKHMPVYVAKLKDHDPAESDNFELTETLINRQSSLTYLV